LESDRNTPKEASRAQKIKTGSRRPAESEQLPRGAEELPTKPENAPQPIQGGSFYVMLGLRADLVIYSA
jgi:hypothetical protein